MDQLNHFADLLRAAGQQLNGRIGALASPTALLAIWLDCETCRKTSLTEADNSSAAAATVLTLSDDRSDAAPTVDARELASLAVAVMDCAVVCIPAAAVDTERTIPLTLRSKSSAMLSMVERRSADARACVSASILSTRIGPHCP